MELQSYNLIATIHKVMCKENIIYTHTQPYTKLIPLYCYIILATCMCCHLDVITVSISLARSESLDFLRTLISVLQVCDCMPSPCNHLDRIFKVISATWLSSLVIDSILAPLASFSKKMPNILQVVPILSRMLISPLFPGKLSSRGNVGLLLESVDKICIANKQ